MVVGSNIKIQRFFCCGGDVTKEVTSSPGCHGDAPEKRGSRSSTGDVIGKKLSGVSETLPIEVCETCLAPQAMPATGQRERLLALKMNGQPQNTDISPTGGSDGVMITSSSDYQVTNKASSPQSQQQCIVGRNSIGSSSASLSSNKDHMTQVIANGKSPSSNSLSEQKTESRKSSRSSEHRISVNNNEPIPESSDLQNEEISLDDIKVSVPEQNVSKTAPSSQPPLQSVTESTSHNTSTDLHSQEQSQSQVKCDNTTVQNPPGTGETSPQTRLETSPETRLETSPQTRLETSPETRLESSSSPDPLSTAQTSTQPELSAQKQSIVISEPPPPAATSASEPGGQSGGESNTPPGGNELNKSKQVPPSGTGDKETSSAAPSASANALSVAPKGKSSLRDRLLGRKGSGPKGSDSSGRRLCDEEDELSEVEPDAVPSEVRDWLALTFTRSMSNIKRRGDDKPKFRSVAHAIRAGIMVDR